MIFQVQIFYYEQFVGVVDVEAPNHQLALSMATDGLHGFLPSVKAKLTMCTACGSVGHTQLLK